VFQPELISRIVVLGRTRCGKTVLSKMLQASYPRVVIIDVVHDYRPDGKTHFFSDFRAFGEFMVRAQHHEKFRVVFQFSIHDQNKEQTADEIFALLYEVGNILVVVDECQFFGACHYMKQLVLVGARKNIAMLTITQRPANLSKDLVSMASDIFIGQLFETNDVKYLKEIINPEDLAKVTGIQKGHFLHFKPGQPSEIISNGF